MAGIFAGRHGSRRWRDGGRTNRWSTSPQPSAVPASSSKRKLRNPELTRVALDRLIADPNGDGMRQADVIVAAIVENLDAKQQLVADIEARARADALHLRGLGGTCQGIPIVTPAQAVQFIGRWTKGRISGPSLFSSYPPQRVGKFFTSPCRLSPSRQRRLLRVRQATHCE